MKTSTSEFSPSLHLPGFGRVAEAKTVSITVSRLPTSKDYLFSNEILEVGIFFVTLSKNLR
jgi:hypothetical protein